MKFLKKLTCAAAVALSMSTAAHADVLTDWVFNPIGGGYASGQTIGEYLDVNGNAFIQLTKTSDSTFSFTEHAVFNSVQADSNGQLFPVNFTGGNITATFEAFGTGDFSGSFKFGGGVIKLYSDPNNDYNTTNGIYGADNGNLIATFNVLAGGGGDVDASGNPISNGQVTVYAKADEGQLAPGYFFRSNGKDLSEESILSFAFTNANGVSNLSNTLVQEVACQFAGFTGAGCAANTTYTNAPGQYFFVGNNGQFKLAEVPEPGSLALFGIAMLGAGVSMRKRAKKS